MPDDAEAAGDETPARASSQSASTPPTALVFDWGKRHVGVALVPGTGDIAIPLKTVHASRSGLDLEAFDVLVRDFDPATLVVGLPRNMDGSPSAETKHAKRFGEHLSNRYERPVTFVDERLTTREAIDRAAKPDPDHSLAALVIAESWLANSSAR